MFMGMSFFRFGKFSSIIFLKILAGPLSWKSSFSSTPITSRFGLHIVSWISWMFEIGSFALCILFDCCSNVLYGIFCTWHSLFHLLYCGADARIYGSRSFLGFLFPALPRFGFSLLCLLPFLVLVWFCSITCLDVFSCFSLRTSTCLAVFSCFSLRACNSLAVLSG